MTTKQQTSNISSWTQDIGFVSLGIFVLAGIGLAFQVALTRVFSLIFQHTFVFLVVSLAILGLGIGAGLGYAFKRITQAQIPLLSILLTASFPLIAILLASINSSEVIFFAVAIAMIPFAFIGWINALVYATYTEHSNRIYAADLLGAVLGLIIAPLLMIVVGPLEAVVVLGLLASVASLFLAMPSGKIKPAIGIIALMVLMTLANQAGGFVTFHPENIVTAPPDKTMIHILNNPASGASIIDTQSGAFAQVDVVETNDDSALFVFTDAGAGSIMLRYDPGLDDLNYSWLQREVSYLPFSNGAVDKTLIIGAGAGYDVVQARLAGAKDITAVEINPAIVDITGAYADFNGDILNLPDVQTIVTDGRNFVDRSDETYDLIYLNLVYSQAARPGSSALAENYTFTTEALGAYLDRLSENGRIGFVTHSGIHGVRLMMTALNAMVEDGISIEDGLRRMALVRSPNPLDPIITPSVLIITHQVWTEDEAQTFGEDALRRDMDILYLPHIFEDALSVLLNGSMTFEEYLATNTDFNIAPTTDNQPFFYHLDAGLPDSLDDLLIWVALAVSGYLLVTLVLQTKSLKNEWIRPILTVYFALLGIGFFLAEVALIQYFRLLIGDPILAFAVAVGAMLLGGGLGSWFGQRYDAGQLPQIIGLFAMGIAGCLVASTLIYPMIVDATLKLSLVVRVMVTVIALLPLGFLMGVPFPGGLQLARLHDRSGVPLFWGMNALASTLGAVLATVLALIVGYQITLFVGAALYSMVAMLMLIVWKKVH